MSSFIGKVDRRADVVWDHCHHLAKLGPHPNWRKHDRRMVLEMATIRASGHFGRRPNPVLHGSAVRAEHLTAGIEDEPPGLVAAHHGGRSGERDPITAANAEFQLLCVVEGVHAGS